MTGGRKRVFVSREIPGDGVERLRAAGFQVDVWRYLDPPPIAALHGAAAVADGLLTMFTERADAGLFDQAPSVRIVANMAVGYDNIDLAAATARGIAVTNTPGVLAETTADLAFALLMAGARRVVEADRAVRTGGWSGWHPTWMVGRDIHGATMGVVGLGEIGSAIARRGRGFGMRILYTSRSRKPEAEADTGAEMRSLPDLLRESDFVVLAAALSPQSRGMIGAGEIALMKPTALFVNIARGALVDQAALVDALENNRIAGAALDVMAIEPVPAGDTLLSLDNVTLTPHIGSASLATRTRMADLAVENIVAYFEDRTPPTCLNPEVLTQRE